jgi:hypothetical protein
MLEKRVISKWSEGARYNAKVSKRRTPVTYWRDVKSLKNDGLNSAPVVGKD